MENPENPDNIMKQLMEQIPLKKKVGRPSTKLANVQQKLNVQSNSMVQIYTLFQSLTKAQKKVVLEHIVRLI